MKTLLAAALTVALLAPSPAHAQPSWGHDPAGLDFGNVLVGGNAYRTLTITNTDSSGDGTFARYVTAHRTSGNDPRLHVETGPALDGSTIGTCGRLHGDDVILDPGESCTVRAEFEPTTTGEWTGTLYVTVTWETCYTMNACVGGHTGVHETVLAVPVRGVGVVPAPEPVPTLAPAPAVVHPYPPLPVKCWKKKYRKSHKAKCRHFVYWKTVPR